MSEVQSPSLQECVNYISRKCVTNPFDYLSEPHDESMYMLLRRLYVETQGLCTSLINKEISRNSVQVKRKLLVDNKTLLSHGQVDLIEAQLRATGGYAISDLRLSDQHIAEARELLDQTSMSNTNSARTFISDWNKLKRLRLVKILCFDPLIRNIVDTYLNCQSWLNMVCAWRTDYVPRVSHNINSDAMHFHFDCDHNKFIKLFVYLDDVNSKNGPHVYVPRTSADFRHSLPTRLQRDGRISSVEVINEGLMPNIIIGNKGCAIFADTHNLHRGTPVQEGRSRYILQLQFVDSVLGAKSSHPVSHFCEMNGVVEYYSSLK